MNCIRCGKYVGEREEKIPHECPYALGECGYCGGPMPDCGCNGFGKILTGGRWDLISKRIEQGLNKSSVARPLEELFVMVRPEKPKSPCGGQRKEETDF